MFNTRLQNWNYEYTPKIEEFNNQNTASWLYDIRGGKSGHIIEWVFSKVNKITWTKVLNPLIPEEWKKINNILELWPWEWKSFDKFLEKIWTNFDNLVLIEWNENSIKKFKEKIQDKKYEKIRHKIYFINADLSTKKWLQLIVSQLSKLNIDNLDIIFAKAFIHHLFTQEQKQLFEFLKQYMDDKSFIYLYNQFIPKDISNLKKDLVIVSILNIVTNYFIKLENIYISKWLTEAKKEASNIKKDTIKQISLWIKNIIVKKIQYFFKKSEFSKYPEVLFNEFLEKLETKLDLHNLEEIIERFFNLYAKLFTNEINKKEHSKYNIQTIENITQILKECWFESKIYPWSLWSKWIKATKK